MNRIFLQGDTLYEPMQEALMALRDTTRANIVLAVGDAEHLHHEGMAEIAERDHGVYHFSEFNFATANQLSIGRFCRELTERPACILANGLDALAQQDEARYQEALGLLNSHREDVRDTQTSLVLWLTSRTHRDLLKLAPDFADWRNATIQFKLGPGEYVPQTALGGMSVEEAEELRCREERFRETLARPNLSPALCRQFREQLAELLNKLGKPKEAEEIRQEAVRIASKLRDPRLDESLYLDYLIRANTYVDPRGVMQTERAATLRLDEIYISLTAERDATVELPIDAYANLLRSDEPERYTFTMRRERGGERVELAQAMCDNAKLVLLGDPGAGKTTLARFLALQFALAYKQSTEMVTDREGNEYGEPRLPILLRIAQYAEAFASNRNLSLREFLHQGFGDSGLPPESLKTIFEEALAAGCAFVILDGLDEIIDPGDRMQIASRIEQLVAGAQSNTRFLVTSRIAGYRTAPLGREFSTRTFTLCDLDRDQTSRFLTRWCPAYERFRTPDATPDDIDRRAKAEIEGILTSLEENEGVRRLATNPLLLTIIALIHRNGASLPGRRIELYELAVNTLLRDWQLARGIRSGDVVEEYEALELLGPLAYWLHENEPTGLIHEQEVKDLLCRFLAQSRSMNETSPETIRAVDDFLRRVREHTGLFVEIAPGRYGFMHLTFEEYFAGREMVSDFQTAAQLIYAHRHQARWEEPIRLAIAYERPKNAAWLIRTAILAEGKEAEDRGFTPSQYEEILHRDLMLAARCLGDCAGAEAALSREVAGRLVDLYLYSERYGPLLSRLGNTLQALGSGEDRLEAERLLLVAMENEDYNVRRYAAQALGRLGSNTSEVIQALLNALQDQEYRARGRAAEALGRLGVNTPEVIQALLNALQKQNELARRGMVLALGRLGVNTPEVIQALLDALQDQNYSVRGSVLQALERLRANTSNVVNALLNALQDQNYSVRGRAAEALGQLNANIPEVIQALLNALQDQNDSVRGRATEALGRLGTNHSEVVQALLSALQDQSKWVQEHAIQTLGQLGANTPEVIQALLNAHQNQDNLVRGSVLQTLRRLGVDIPEVIQALLNALQDQNESIRNKALEGLYQLVA